MSLPACFAQQGQWRETFHIYRIGVSTSFNGVSNGADISLVNCNKEVRIDIACRVIFKDSLFQFFGE